jgi:hypothetical protein
MKAEKLTLAFGKVKISSNLDNDGFIEVMVQKPTWSRFERIIKIIEAANRQPMSCFVGKKDREKGM